MGVKASKASKRAGTGNSDSSGPLELIVTAKTGRKYVSFLLRCVREAHKDINPPLRELSLALVGDARMSRLHAQFMNITGSTDVLTFPLEFDQKGRVISGEVIICVPEAVRQATALGMTVEQELLLYALHGMLHLCGFDDKNASAYRKMHRTEDAILTRLGLGPVFSEGAR